MLFDVGRANMPVYASAIDVTGDRTLEGWVEAGGFCGAHDRHRVFFSARFDRPFEATGTWRDGQLTAGGRHSAGARESNGAWVTFGATRRSIGLEVGISYASAGGARRNLAAEADGQSFDRVATAAARAGRRCSPGRRSSAARTIAASRSTSALYHAFLHPNVIGDVDGAYPGADGRQVHRRDGSHGDGELLTVGHLPHPESAARAPRTRRRARRRALDPRRRTHRRLAAALVAGRGGDQRHDRRSRHALPGRELVCGLLAGHEQEAYRRLRANAMRPAPPPLSVTGRAGARSYARRGYIASGLPDCDSDCRHPASATLEYAAADGALAMMARALGHRRDARLFERRARGYRKLWNPRLRTFSPRGADGSWLSPYDPRTGSGQFHEGSAYQYQWLAPQDPAGLVSLLGGRRATAERLDAFFAYGALLREPFSTARHAWVDHPYDYYGAVTYNPNNEPDLHAPYLYAWTGQPWKTATVVRAAEALFTNGPEGMTGNDDLGTISAWYVLSSLGLYPTMSGAGYFVLSTPQFPHAVVSRGATGKTLRIDASSTSDTQRYIATARLNGSPVRRTWLPRDAIARGGRLEYEVSARPTRWGTGGSAAPPSVARGR